MEYQGHAPSTHSILACTLHRPMASIAGRVVLPGVSSSPPGFDVGSCLPDRLLTYSTVIIGTVPFFWSQVLAMTRLAGRAINANFGQFQYLPVLFTRDKSKNLFISAIIHTGKWAAIVRISGA